MADLLTAARMRAIENAAIKAGSVTGAQLMESAGECVLAAILARWPGMAAAPHRALVLCGPGNNGGDGFVVARLLRGRGWTVALFLAGDADRLPPDARANHDRWDGAVTPYEDTAFAREAGPLGPQDLILDALFGTGLTRPVDGFEAFRAAAQRGGGRPKVVAVDVPSGLCSDSGRVLHREGAPAEPPVRADLTVSFHAEKQGHRLADGPDACGAIQVAPIGLPPRADIAAEDSPVTLNERPEAFDKGEGAHKYAHGHAIVLSGPPGTGGAARLAARGALRIGAGLVSVCCEDAAVPEHAARLDAVMIKRANGADGLARLLEDSRLNALCLGPGLGQGARDLVPVALKAGRATVLDADALTAFAGDPGALFGLLHENAVLTPHAGEFGRVFPDIAERLAATPDHGPAFSKIDAVREAAKHAGCTILLKGPDTVIAAPDGRCTVNSAHYDRAAPWLATAGTGDVLAGFVTGLLAQGMEAFDAARIAAWLHVEAARRFGPGLISEDLPEALPACLRDLAAAP
ncbi:NAD(P)H-hydrate dehydratase [Citreimonas salinaria]|uniref:Bifunctional NAD(P)H-hydrate repair enzyme n=1 Tax=Citreimonas salinaria TaxID=321339 RepID=A0A1H3H182_9RHOB|nr:NAD(P)H-hydrate dehydratase [Citreimonas salinaria]SDY09221.1 yjeF C-terminal region, hydroxyethylthiazole kinase-related/yjeF N-terminal region [Citreimonas salinaria]